MAKEKQEEKDIIEGNLRFYNKGKEVPKDALKEIKAGRLKGMSDVNPMWRMKRMTEMFGPCGIGWKYEIVKQWSETYGNEVKCFCNVNLYVRDPETKEWSAPIPGNGGSSIVTQERNGLYVNDEGYKMALTDALSIAMKPLGIGANIWYGPKATGHNESKYEYSTTQQAVNHQNQPNTQQVYGSPDMIEQQAMAELNALKNIQEFNNFWAKWQSISPALCDNGTRFYKLVCAKHKQLATPKQQ